MNMKKLRSYLQISKEGSYTVEAAFVMAIMLFLIAALLTEAFDIHSQVAGDMILQEALEQAGHMEEGASADQIAKEAEKDLRDYFWCGDKTIEIKESELRLEGAATGKQNSSITVKRFDPEKFLRLLRAVGV